MNRAYCNSCHNLVHARPETRDNRVFLVKDCPSCGRTETIISADAERYALKRSLDPGYNYTGCMLNCLECNHKARPTFVFVDVTNRCNLNCPICINNTPSMGFVFEPPMEYFDRIFRDLARYSPPPTVQLFGGEPTVRDDLFEIIDLSRSYGLPTRVVTNGLKLADEDYCSRLVRSRATILIAYDGSTPDIYRVLRGSTNALRLKEKALENVRKAGAAKVALMTCVAKGFNDKELPALLSFCHQRKDYIRGIYFMPLAHTWDPRAFSLNPQRITGEDIESAVNDCFPDVRVEFIPAGILGEISTVMRHLKIKPPPFAGAHPNCESLYLLVSDGNTYVPLDALLRKPATELIRALLQVEKKLRRSAAALECNLAGRILRTVGLAQSYLSLRAGLSVAWTLRRHANLARVLKGLGISKAWHAAAALAGLLAGRKTRDVLQHHTTIREVFQIIILPFEDRFVLETERLERCPNAFAFWDPQDDAVKTIPVCAWGRHKTSVLHRIADHYAAAASALAGAPAGNTVQSPASST